MKIKNLSITMVSNINNYFFKERIQTEPEERVEHSFKNDDVR